MKLAILASGTGSTAEVLFNKAAVVISNNLDAKVIEKAKNAGIPVEFVERGALSLDQYGERLLEVLGKYKFDFISQNGWDMITPANVCLKYEGKITNNHPAPLDPGHPDFGGKGMKGLAVHQAVLNFFKRVGRPFNSEVCIHLVNSELDKGELLAYKPVEVMEEDTAMRLQAKVKEVEKGLIEEFWNQVEREGVLVPIERGSRVVQPEEFALLYESKADAIAQFPKG